MVRTVRWTKELIRWTAISSLQGKDIWQYVLRNGNLNTPEIFVVGGRGAPIHNKKNLVLFRRHSLTSLHTPVLNILL